jgi:hypothetical protein
MLKINFLSRVKVIFSLLFIAVLIALMPMPAKGQYNYYNSSSFLFNQYNYPKIINYPREYDDDKPSRRSTQASKPAKPEAKQEAKSEAPAAFAKATTKANATNNPLPYTRNSALAKKIREEFLADFAKQRTEETVNDVRELTEQNDFVQVIAGYILLQGLDSAAMENFLAFWYGQAWAISQQKPLPTAKQYQGIAVQLKKSMAKSESWSNMSNEKRQTYFEQLAYPMFIQKANYQAYLKQGKTEAMARMASATQEGFKKMGVDLQKMRLSDEGFSGF